MNTCFTSVVTSNGSPLATTTLAVLPTSSDPSRSSTPQICAGYSVSAFMASSYGSPNATANPAAYGRFRTWCASNDANAIFTPRFDNSLGTLYTASYRSHAFG